ncbi:MAG: hypothetical protein ACKVZ6_20690 [Kineosporiaceae bacterium]
MPTAIAVAGLFPAAWLHAGDRWLLRDQSLRQGLPPRVRLDGTPA